MRKTTVERTRLRGAEWLLVLLCGLGLLAQSPRAAADNEAWKSLGGAHTETPRAELVRLLQKDGIKQPKALLEHPYLLRLEIRDAGGGSAKHSEVVVRFRSLPGKVMAKAWTQGSSEAHRAQVGAWTSCQEKASGVGRNCALHFNGRGFVDVTSAFTDRNVLFVHEPARRAQGNTIVWFAADTSQQHLWYYSVPRTEMPSFGSGRVKVSKYLVAKPEPPARLPGTPPDPGSDPGLDPGKTPDPRPVPRPLPQPVPRPDPPAPQPMPQPPPLPRPTPDAWIGVSDLHRTVTRDELQGRLRAEGIAFPGHLLGSRYLARVALTEAGRGSRSRTELQLRFLSQPTKALGKAWADQPGVRRGQIGAEDLCTTLPAAQGGPQSKRCPVHFAGLGWRDLITAFRSVLMRMVLDPNNNDAGHMVLWLAFDHPQTGMAHRLVHRDTLPSLGGGNVAIELVEISQGDSPPPGGTPGGAPLPGLGSDPGTVPGPASDPVGPSKGSFAVLGGAPRPAGRNALAQRMRRDGVAQPDHLLAHPYVVRLSVSQAGASQGQRSEVVLKVSALPKAALGNAWGDHRHGWGAQLGALSRCRRLPKPVNPYGDGQGWERQPTGHICPLQYNGLGWRDLVGGFSEKEVMLITAPTRATRGNQLLWLAFAEAPTFHVRPASEGEGLRAKVRAEAFRLVDRGAQPDEALPGPLPGPARPEVPHATSPTAPSDPDTQAPQAPQASQGWIQPQGAHRVMDKNALYWAIRKDGFENPWHLLKTRYVVRLEVTGGKDRTETLVRFGAAPREAVGKGSGPNRSGVQAGSPDACRKAQGSPAHCPLHYANIGWRNLISGLSSGTLLFVTDPGRGSGQAPSTVLWLSFDGPQEEAAFRHLSLAPGQAKVRIQRFRW